MLFGHQDNSRLANAGIQKSGTAVATFAGNPPTIDPSGTQGLPSLPDNFESDTMEHNTSALNQSAAIDTSATIPDPLPAPATDSLDQIVSTAPEEATTAPIANEQKSFDADLLTLKQQALAELEPLVGHLDQNPEEKFRTTMMLIQSADKQELIKVAYEAAQAITDEKVKAQALLDVVNEINYFAQKDKVSQ